MKCEQSLAIFTEHLNLEYYLSVGLLVHVFDNYYRPPEGGRLYDMKVVSGYAFLQTYNA